MNCDRTMFRTLKKQYSWRSFCVVKVSVIPNTPKDIHTDTPEGGGGVLGFSFARYVPLASQSPCPIIVYFVASYRPHLGQFWENVIFAIPTKSLSIYVSTLSIL